MQKCKINNVQKTLSMYLLCLLKEQQSVLLQQKPKKTLERGKEERMELSQIRSHMKVFYITHV